LSHYGNIKIAGGDTGAPLNLSKRIKLLCNYLDLKDKYILDCGCGTGEYVAELLNYSAHVYGVEYSGNKLGVFKHKHQKQNALIRGDIEKLCFKSRSFDFVLLNEVLEHIPNELKALKEISLVLKAEGFLCIFSPNRFYPFETHAVTLWGSKKPLPIWVPFIPYIPISLGKYFLKFTARNYFPWELKKLLHKR